MQDLQLIIFDWDGTLSDSADRIVKAVHQGAREVGLPERSDQDVRNIIGLGLLESFRVLYPEIDEVQLEPFSAAYRDAYLDSTQSTAVLFDGVVDTLNVLREKYTLAVATGKSRVGLDRELAETGLTSYFAATRCADETLPKPDPLMLVELFTEIGIGPEHSLMIGDTDHDIGTARNGGVVAVAVTCGAQLVDRLEAAKPAALLNDVTELPEWLNQGGSGSFASDFTPGV